MKARAGYCVMLPQKQFILFSYLTVTISFNKLQELVIMPAANPPTWKILTVSYNFLQFIEMLSILKHLLKFNASSRAISYI